MGTRAWVSRNELGLFFVLAYLFSWAVWPLVLANPDSSPSVPFGPLIAAFVVIAIAYGRRGLGAWARQLGHWRVHPLWYAVALLGPFLLTSLAGVVAVAAGAPSTEVGAYADVIGILTTLAVTAVIVGLFEEMGWRGFALPRMQEKHGALFAALAIGIIWALWHLPELISDPGEREPVPFLVAIVSYSVLLTWMYNSTRGSLPIVILFHAAINTSARFLLPEFEGQHEVAAWWSYAGVYAAAATGVVAFAGAKHLSSGRPLGGEAHTRSTDNHAERVDE